jgi:hypothetical protein
VAQVTVHKCDRCGREMDRFVVIVAHYHHTKTLELCATDGQTKGCEALFREWLDQTGNTNAW